MKKFRLPNRLLGASLSVFMGLAVMSCSSKQPGNTNFGLFGFGGVGPKGGGGAGGTNSPLVVRGGAMTFRATSSKWGTDGTKVCVQLKYPHRVELLGISSEPPASPAVAQDAGIALPTPTATMPIPWQIDFFGRSSTGTVAGDGPSGFIYPDGIRIYPTANCLASGATSVGVDVVFEPNNGQSGFYGPAVDEDGQTNSHRYKDGDFTSSANADKDLAERLGLVVINLGSSTNSLPTANNADPRKTPSNLQYRCLNGECVVGIGQSE